MKKDLFDIAKEIESIFVENELSIDEAELVLEKINFDLENKRGKIKVSSFLN